MRRIKKIIDDYLENTGILDIFNDIDLCEIQNCIYEHRKTAFKIPDFIYNKDAFQTGKDGSYYSCRTYCEIH